MQHFADDFGSVDTAHAADRIKDRIGLDGDLGTQIPQLVSHALRPIGEGIIQIGGIKKRRHLRGRHVVKLFFCRIDGGIYAKLALSDDLNLVRGTPGNDLRPLRNGALGDTECARRGALTAKVLDYVRFEHAL
jgi:hypothetical protein